MRLSTLMTVVLLVVTACTKTPAAPTSAPPKPLPFTQLNALSIGNLNHEQLLPFLKLANEEVCPCDCPKTFAACLQSDSQCKPAHILGQWIVDRIKEGVPFDVMVEGLSQEVGSGFAARPTLIDIGGYASKGSATPTITLVEFADFQCAHCRTTSEVLDKLVKKYPQKIKLVFKHFPLSNAHPMAKQAALAAESAARQGKFWQMHDALFSSKDVLSNDVINKLAQKIGLKDKQFKADMTNPEVISKVETSLAEGERLGIKGTPSLFFNGRQYFLSLDESGLMLRLQMEEARPKSSC